MLNPKHFTVEGNHCSRSSWFTRLWNIRILCTSNVCTIHLSQTTNTGWFHGILLYTAYIPDSYDFYFIPYIILLRENDVRFCITGIRAQYGHVVHNKANHHLVYIYCVQAWYERPMYYYLKIVMKRIYLIWCARRVSGIPFIMYAKKPKIGKTKIVIVFESK